MNAAPGVESFDAIPSHTRIYPLIYGGGRFFLGDKMHGCTVDGWLGRVG